MTGKNRSKNEGTLLQLPSGRWKVEVTINRQRYYHTAGTKQECLVWLRETKNKIDRGFAPDSHRTTVMNYLHGWLGNMKTSLRETTFAQYELYTTTHIIPKLGKLRLSDLNPGHIQQFYDLLLQEGVPVSVIQKTHTILRSALTRAAKTRIIPYNPAENVVVPSNPNKNKEMQVLTEIQANQFLLSVKGHPHEALFTLAITTGMREMELLGLKWSDIDWDKETLQVSRQLLRSKKFADLKTKNGRRSIKLGPKTVEALRNHYDRQNQDRIRTGEKWHETGLIFTAHNGNPLIWRNVFRDYKKQLKKAGLPLIRFHDLRHTGLSLMLINKVPVLIVSKRAGHARPSITLNIYGHLIPGAQDEAADLMDDMVIPIDPDPAKP